MNYLLYFFYKRMQSQQQQMKTVKIVAMSDTHDWHHKINLKGLPEGDIFIHAGDFTKYSTKAQLQRFYDFLKLIPYKHKIVIAGNHDFALDKENYINHLSKTKHKGHQTIDPDQQIKKLKGLCIYLQHQMVQIQGLKIFGSPYQPQFFDWGFMYKRQPITQSEKIWSSIPKNIDVLVTHGPPYGILDKTIKNEHAGCEGLLNIVKIVKPQVHIFGHIHEGYGKEQIDGIRYYNASNVNLAYKLVNEPFQILVKPRLSQQKIENN